MSVNETGGDVTRRRVVGVRVAGLLGLAAACVLASSAQAETRFVVEGRGFGHGVGLSQYGARGAALQGWDAPRILAWYYRGSRLETLPTTTVRVLIADARGQVRAVFSGPGAVVDPATGTRTELTAGVSYRLRPSTSGVNVLAPDDSVVVAGPAILRLSPATSPGLSLDGRRFRGDMEIRNDRGALDAINVLDLEDYLPGVLPGEMPSSWGNDTPAALRAQAVAARSYALAKRTTGSSFDLYSDTRSQVYGGFDSEDVRATAAVRATAGQILTCNGKLLTTYFFSTSGGQTENVEHGLGGAASPCLVGVPDPFDSVSPLHVWPDPVTYTAAELGQRLGLGSPVTAADVAKRGVSPRVITLRVTTADGVTHDLTGSSVKRTLGLRDTWFVVRGQGQTNPPTAPTPRGEVRPATKNLLVVAARMPRKTRAVAIARKIVRSRPGVSVVRRANLYLVVTDRFSTPAGANTERIALRRLGYRATVTRARRGDRAVRATIGSSANRPTSNPAPAAPAAPVAPGVAPPAPAGPATFTVVASEHERLEDAQKAAVRLTRKKHRATVVAHSASAGVVTYRVVTVRGVSRAQAVSERDELRELGVQARVLRDGSGGA